MDEGFDLSRREFIRASSVLPLATMSGSGISKQISQDNVDILKPVAWLLGTVDKSPNDIPELQPGGDFFETDTHTKTLYAYIYQQPNGDQWYITDELNEWKQIRMNPETQVDEVRVEDFTTFFDHTFARPESPDNKNWNYTDADVTKDASEIELSATTVLESRQRGNYPPGSESIPGIAMRLTGEPTAGEALGGYFHANDGGGVGEDTTDSFVFMRKGGATEKVYRENWNGYVPDSRLWLNSSPVITRFPHLFYGGGAFNVRALVYIGNSPMLKTLHTFTPENTDLGDGPLFDQPNLPIRFESDGLSGGNLRANACHYEFADSHSEHRINGEHFENISISETDWTPIISWRKRSGWEMVNVKPIKIAAFARTNDIKLELQLGTTLDAPTWNLPDNTDSAETSVEVSIGGTITSDGERRWPGYAAQGSGNAPGSVADEDVDFNLDSDRTVTLAAQGVGGSAEAYGAIAWEEFF